MLRRISILILLLCSIGLSGQRSNPFDLIRNDEAELKQDTASTSLIDAQETLSDTVETKLEGENPFTVSHIPIRVNQYRQIEQLNINRDQERETISLSYAPLWVLAFSLVLLASILYTKKNHILTLVRSLSNDNFMRLTNYENNEGFTRVYFSGYMLFLINIILFIFLTLTQVFNLPQDGLSLWIIIGSIVFFVGKHIVVWMAAWLYELQKEASLYNFTIVTITNLLAVIFLFLNILFVFGPEVWASAIAISGSFFFIIFLISRYYKGLRIGRSYVNDYFFQFFLYFCAFEFSPWVIIYKMIKDLI